ncbi:MAG: SIR2 family protein [Pyrinomonadaceae bacterium]
MRHLENPEAELRKAIHDRRAIAIAGTGVSIGASRNPSTGESHPQASWAGLLKNGLEWLTKHDLISEGRAAAHLLLLNEDPQTHNFISAAQDVVRQMGGVQSEHFKNWLKLTVGSIKAHDNAVLDALHGFRKQGTLLATTNYDDLLLTRDKTLSPITWKDRDAFLRSANKKETDKIIFLHGYWRRPNSVILDWDSYHGIARDDRYRQDLEAVWKMTTWIYVGCGANGLSDPDFGLLLERYGKRSREADLWDFCLVRSDQREDFQACFDNQQVNISAVSFGDSHDDLPQYLRTLLPAAAVPIPMASTRASRAVIPKPPVFYAVPRYSGSHKFVGRESELQDLSDWAKPADQTNLLLFEAIGGNGKSMLTWEWATNHATKVRSDWAGFFWYSFYEKGAVMADCCRHALAYMTRRPLKELEKTPVEELAKVLLAQLHEQSWLLVLDGLERVLVHYHRIDANEVRDDEANAPADTVLGRNPRDTIRDEDSDLLRALAAARPSKILVSSRLMPRVLLNPGGQPIPGVKRITLPGLRPTDGERLLTSCDVTGDSQRIQEYLTENCDNHPLVIGVLAGLINTPGPNRGNFDAWLDDTGSQGGARLDLGNLDLIQRRNHILRAAINALSEKSRQLLSTLALLPESVDYEMLVAFNPHLPPEPEEVDKPKSPEAGVVWPLLSPERKADARREYKAAYKRWQGYQQALTAWRESEEVGKAPKGLVDTVADLEQRGLLQYDARTRRHDLHPVVRAVAAHDLGAADKERYGQRVLDYFTEMPHSPYEQAKTLEEVAPGMHIVRTHLKLGRFQEAADAFRGDLSYALIFNLEAHFEILALLRPFFDEDWGKQTKEIDASAASYLATSAGIALRTRDEFDSALTALGVSLALDLEAEHWDAINSGIRNISSCFLKKNLLARTHRAIELALDLARARGNKTHLFISESFFYGDQTIIGEWAAAAETWRRLESMGRDWPRYIYRQGDVEYWCALNHFWQGTLEQQHLDAIIGLAKRDNNRPTLRKLYSLCGEWRLEQGNWGLAASSFQEALRMARERRLPDKASEAGLALAKFHLGQFGSPEEARQEAEWMSAQRRPAHRYLALLWRAIGDAEQAQKHALSTYKWAWADGEPYVNRYALTKATELLNEMNIPIPALPPYRAEKEEPFPWEAAVRAAIEKLRTENEAKKGKED